jgi:hypothetical protein
MKLTHDELEFLSAGARGMGAGRLPSHRLQPAHGCRASNENHEGKSGHSSG